jgi:hypothetical protein
MEILYLIFKYLRNIGIKKKLYLCIKIKKKNKEILYYLVERMDVYSFRMFY